MSTFLRFSITVNVLLALLVSWLLFGRYAGSSRPSAATPVPIANVPAETRAQPAAAQQPTPATAPTPFRWSELESTDYHVYLANLRKIGCPEQTIRDIITADVESVFAQRRRQVEQAATNSFAGQMKMETQLDQMRHEEASFLASLLGDTLPSMETAATTNAAPRGLPVRNIRPVAPLVFAEVNPAAVQLNAQQMEIVNSVRQQFRQEVGGDTNDPAYGQKWVRAQRNADDRLRGLLGSQVYLQFQLQAAYPTAH